MKSTTLILALASTIVNAMALPADMPLPPAPTVGGPQEPSIPAPQMPIIVAPQEPVMGTMRRRARRQAVPAPQEPQPVFGSSPAAPGAPVGIPIPPPAIGVPEFPSKRAEGPQEPTVNDPSIPAPPEPVFGSSPGAPGAPVGIPIPPPAIGVPEFPTKRSEGPEEPTIGDPSVPAPQEPQVGNPNIPTPPEPVLGSSPAAPGAPVGIPIPPPAIGVPEFPTKRSEGPQEPTVGNPSIPTPPEPVFGSSPAAPGSPVGIPIPPPAIGVPEFPTKRADAPEEPTVGNPNIPTPPEPVFGSSPAAPGAPGGIPIPPPAIGVPQFPRAAPQEPEIPAPAEPSKIPAPLEPGKIPAPSEPHRIPAPQEPGRIPAPEEPHRIPAPQEPSKIPAPQEPSKIPAPVEPKPSNLQ
ncbi:hypothetical protein PT974_11023 [Cladobotryum mycophilum]|uniref:Uncharacterized protein n=1 Tax=Cladobotryum mycophilum TaxID=491253 RepID=A0ABR0SBG5_9HYPO